MFNHFVCGSLIWRTAESTLITPRGIGTAWSWICRSYTAYDSTLSLLEKILLCEDGEFDGLPLPIMAFLVCSVIVVTCPRVERKDCKLMIVLICEMM